jgi:hypothetical protein
MNPHIATARIPLNVRFGQPGRGAPLQHEDDFYPASESPLTWGHLRDPIANRAAGLLDRCEKTHTCPKIIQTVSSTEYWQNRMSLNTTDAWGKRDLEIPGNVRIYHLAGTQHAPATIPSRGVCQQLNNPNPQFETRRALLVALERWILQETLPPASRYPSIKLGTLVPPDPASFTWPKVPGLAYAGLLSKGRLFDYGSAFNAQDESGILREPPAQQAREYTVLVPKVDSDGNEVDGVRSTTLQAPTATYTAWNLRREGFAGGELCGLDGSFIPFARTKAERESAHDGRLSLEERYHDHAGYVAAVARAADQLKADGFLLPEDATRLVHDAESGAVLRKK